MRTPKVFGADHKCIQFRGDLKTPLFGDELKSLTSLKDRKSLHSLDYPIGYLFRDHLKSL